jgi:hypothetical protein
MSEKQFERRSALIFEILFETMLLNLAKIVTG